ncbi:MAG TPA: DUF308 domain-containing protein [Patescibacteria group bacterium]|nr:DUF308 domain-containing protein [Patescibacteria group bacterium]
MATASPAHGLQGPLQVAQKITGWFIVVSVLFIVIGVFAIVEPAVAGLGVTLLVGWLLIFGAVGHFLAAFKGGGALQVSFQILIAVVYVFGGVYCITHPLLAIGTLTLLLAAVILAAGVIEIISYFRLKGHVASGWMLLNGIVALLLGGMIWLHWPSSTVWAIGTLVGVRLLMTGMTRLMFGIAARKLLRRAEG